MRVISLVNKKYFHFGQFLLATRKLVDAEFIVYGSGLTQDQKDQLKSHNMSFENVPEKEFETRMQFLKFKILLEHSGDHRTLVDWDTLFLNDWQEAVFGTDLDLGITVRNEYIKRGVQRAYANGGVVFCGNTKSADDMCRFALKVMETGKSSRLPEYDSVFRTLEENRPKHKTWHRENLRWWCDQVFLSALIQNHFHKTIKKGVKDKRFFDFEDFKIGMFSCNRYNLLDPPPSAVGKKRAFILHLKNQGRSVLKSYRKAVKTMMGEE